MCQAGACLSSSDDLTEGHAKQKNNDTQILYLLSKWIQSLLNRLLRAVIA